jgi:hypothetical protein
MSLIKIEISFFEKVLFFFFKKLEIKKKKKMLRSTFIFKTPSTTSARLAASLAQRISEFNSPYRVGSDKVKQCSTRLVMHVAKHDPYLSLLPVSALASSAAESLKIAAEFANKESLTQAMTRELLSRSDKKVQDIDLSTFSETSDRNISFMVAKREHLRSHVFTPEEQDQMLEQIDQELKTNKKLSNKERQELKKKQAELQKLQQQQSAADDDDQSMVIGKFNNFYDLLTRDSKICRDVKPVEKRIATIFNLISAHGYREDYSPEQIAAAKAKVGNKSARYVSTFKYSTPREFYARRRLVTDRSLQTILSSGETHDIRKVAWILFFDSMFTRFPCRPKKDPAHDMLELWQVWQHDPSARALPFIERFVALLTHPNLDKMLREAVKTTDQRVKNEVNRHDSFFKYRQRVASRVLPEFYNARKEIQRKGFTLDQVAWKLQAQRDRDVFLSSVPTFCAVMETSQPYRSVYCFSHLQKALTDTQKDDEFTYNQTEL